MTMMRLDGTVAFVTGASSGIGRSVAIALAARGAGLVLAARRRRHLESVADEIRTAHGVRVLTVALDVRRQSDVETMVRSLPTEWAAIDILVNNAGLCRGLEKLHEGSLQDWDEMLDTNVKGLLYVSRAVLPGMVERNRGHVVNIGSVAGREVYPGGSVYCASKFAERAISKGMLIDLNGTEIRVTTVDPGMVETEFSLVRFHGDSVRAKRVYEGLRPLSPDDVADAVVYAVTRPKHMNVAEMVLMPTCQAGAMVVSRKG
jgi:3-hydroxy acid dehydrogenase / malonic semialdehyde reductase